jgi:ADP-heptose:LPS heptosyltransferase
MRSYKIQQPFLCVHPGSRLPLKKWPSEKYATLYDKIIKRYGIPLVILGSEQEREMVRSIVDGMKYRPIALAGKLSLRELAGIVSQSALFICNDSAPMHIAAAMKTPTVAIFGPSKSCETGPYGEKCWVVEKDFPCRFTCDESVCKHKVYQACMNAVTPEDVLSAVKKLID